LYDNTEVEYFPLGEHKFKAMLEELEKAKEFIFMEYYIVDEGIMWDSILDILEKKAREGVEVRFMYDGMCSINLLPHDYPQKLNSLGIQCKVFSPIRPAISSHQNNRDHRKICVIDGIVAFTGGVNLSDEYINKINKFGHWKDTAVMFRGNAVKNFTVMFLQNWNIYTSNKEDYGKYIKTSDIKAEGYVLPYGDNPFDKENVGELVYMDILNNARDYVHIMTPYLVPDNEMMLCLEYAAKRGVDVKIILPHITDNPTEYKIARTIYPRLIERGIKIYEYTPGFVHAKTVVSDDRKAVVGTINMDYRSMYLNMECAVYIQGMDEIHKIENDFQNTLYKCELIDLDNCKKYSLIKKIIGKILWLISPLM
jgi:cardiolipin synthase